MDRSDHQHAHGRDLDGEEKRAAVGFDNAAFARKEALGEELG
jgi:hypothetical protein